MFCPRFLLVLLCLGGPLTGWAQEVAPAAGPLPPPPLVPAPPLVPGGDAAEAAPSVHPSRPRGELIPRARYVPPPPGRFPRLAAEALGGVLGTGVGLLPGSLLLMTSLQGDREHDASVGLGVFFLVAGIPLGSAVGIVAGGSWLGGQGRFWPVLGGVLLGLLAAPLTFLVPPLGVLAPLCPLIGGMVAYEWSHQTALRSAALAASGMRVVPLIHVDRAGGLVGGLAGVF
ncbi:hypothetical protein [Stigmatella aurantiaca]|uniref:Uncharacterized protein n=1 Tax=Stigmatella aurantiaca (strain DW4/3-1) TaxID=378806 RepID=E3FH71_STIAD|nr:hypothetical protein [Stigmatella aurantiaca]ADO75287.1 uncharacterized protein STAUR_7532 [Stigmatella aurantiaca DW4/3-1]